MSCGGLPSRATRSRPDSSTPKRTAPVIAAASPPPAGQRVMLAAVTLEPSGGVAKPTGAMYLKGAAEASSAMRPHRAAPRHRSRRARNPNGSETMTDPAFGHPGGTRGGVAHNLARATSPNNKQGNSSLAPLCIPGRVANPRPRNVGLCSGSILRRSLRRSRGRAISLDSLYSAHAWTRWWRPWRAGSARRGRLTSGLTQECPDPARL